MRAFSELPDASEASLSKPASLPQPDCTAHPTLFVGNSLDEWAQPASLAYNGLLVKRPFHGKWDEYQGGIDNALPNFGDYQALMAQAPNGYPMKFSNAVSIMLGLARLPAPLSAQIYQDACSLGSIIGSMCPAGRELDIKLEIFGSNTCARWHRDNFVGRGIVSYTGSSGTEYTKSANVDEWELKNCGNSDHIIRDAKLIESVAVGDYLLIKGSKYLGGADGLW